MNNLNTLYKGMVEMEERFTRLYTELEFLLNNAPVESDCTDEENKMYSDMADLKASMEEALWHLLI